MMNTYDSYVLRIWRRGAGQEYQWRARLEHMQSQEIWHFDERAALLAIINAMIDALPGGPMEEPTAQRGSVSDDT